MYIYLHDDLEFLDLKNAPELVDKLSLLISSAAHGCNLLDAKKKTFKSLIQSGCLSATDITRLEQIQRFNYEYKDFFDSLNYKIVININSSSVYKDEEKDIWYFPLEKIEYGFLCTVELLAEDINDGELLLYAVEHYIKLNDLRKLKFKITPRNGGGANIAKNFQRFLEDQSNFVVAFCDSDKFSPEAHFSQVTQECHNLANQNNSFGCFMYTEGREIENDIPLVFIEEGHLDHPLVLKNINEVFNLKEKLKSPFFKYIDLKEGLKPEWILSLGNGSKCKIFWEMVIDELNALGTEFITENKSEARANQELIISQICSSMASNVLAWLKHQTRNHPKSPHLQLTSGDDVVIWLNHGKNLFELGCAMPKIRL
ncbi:hypothetical protein [Acinetobacter ursingii]|uniref:hypothetical protein n=2 Tax=Acinetobacter ursingii TaxID=108980 RepID=UPI001250ACDC|nr:hypothetical protein [Acinetobacter ursingii]MCU4351790.1 hypothetical protein [Acinetobacter ursingii]MCU4604896.1 hypothetical protein [Acinetobacter ursingii]